MNKIKLAICMKDLEYQTRFVNCFINHYNHQYELHVFTALEQMETITPKEYAVIITGEYTTDEMLHFVEKGEIILNLTEDFREGKDSSEETCVYTEKYQEVYKVAEFIERLIADMVSIQGKTSRTVEYESFGVYSLTQGMYQVPYAALLGKVIGEQKKVLVLDLQNYSGFCEVEEGMASMGLEDLLSVVMTGNHSKSRILECIRHESNWDYVCAVQNNQCLAEGSKELYEAIIELLVQELGYQTIIINFGSAFLGQLEMMEQCEKIYFLYGKDTVDNWRENTFFHELLRQGKETILQKVRKIEIPSNSSRETTWRALAEKWSWGQIGTLLRQGAEKEKPYGAVV